MIAVRQQQQQHSSRRYQRLLQAIDKTLGESRNAVDTAACIKDTYRDDITIFGSSDMLTSVFDSMIEKVHEQVKEGMIEVMERESVLDRLYQVEEIIDRLEREQQAKEEANRQDRQRARQALEHQTLPNSLLPSDVVQYQTYQVIQQEKDALLQEITKVTNEIQDLERHCAHMERHLKESIQSVEGLEQELKQTADACSSIFETDA